MAEEQVDIIDAKDRVVGRASRARMRAENLWHRTVAILVCDREGRLFVHQRSHEKDLFPGLFDPFVSGCVRAGDGYNATALRELAEEVGIEGATPVPLFPHVYDGPETRTRTWIFRVAWNGPVHFADGEVIWGDFLPLHTLLSAPERYPLVPDGAAHLQAARRLGFLA